MSRILAQSVTADLFGRLFNRLLFLLLLPVILILALVSALRPEPEKAVPVSVMQRRRGQGARPGSASKAT